MRKKNKNTNPRKKLIFVALCISVFIFGQTAGAAVCTMIASCYTAVGALVWEFLRYAAPVTGLIFSLWILPEIYRDVRRILRDAR